MADPARSQSHTPVWVAAVMLLVVVGIIVYVVLSVVLSVGPNRTAQSIVIPIQHDVVFHDTEGNAVQISQLKGKWIIVNYWAAWCDGCIDEIPELNALNQLNKSNQMHQHAVVMYGVNYDQEPLSLLKVTMATIGITFPVLTQDPGRVWHLGPVSMLPTTFIIDPHGHVVRKMVGKNTRKSLLAALQQLQASP